jgi:tetratricopeptide (TPR) repeat protein
VVAARGRLTVRFEIPDLMRAIRKQDETPWVGRVPTRPGLLSLVIAPSSGPAETAARYRLEARQAMFKKEYIKSIEAYSRAVAADPSDRQAESGLAGALLAAGRYRAAVAIYEKRWPSMSPASAEYPLVVMAYLGMGDVETARSLLQRMGVTSDRVNEKVAEYRDANRRRDRPR